MAGELPHYTKRDFRSSRTRHCSIELSGTGDTERAGKNKSNFTLRAELGTYSANDNATFTAGGVFSADKLPLNHLLPASLAVVADKTLALDVPCLGLAVARLLIVALAVALSFAGGAGVRVRLPVVGVGSRHALAAGCVELPQTLHALNGCAVDF